jgi:polygalacturonase
MKMFHWPCFLPFLCLAALCGRAQTPAPSTVFNVRSFGAVGDGRSLDTGAINRAIEAAAGAGGGTVLFPPGTYLSASIHLRSNITLYLEAAATVEAVDENLEKYDDPEPNDWTSYQDFGHSHWHNSLIWGADLHDVSILGPGLIFGKGLSNGHVNGVYKDPPKGWGNKAIALKGCRNVTLRDISILHGGHFAILATGVDNLTIDNVKIDTNRDGMDIDCCKNVRVSNCSVNSPWDDGICLKASYALGFIRPCQDITIANCFLSGNFDEGTLLDGTFKRSAPGYKSFRTGRIKLGTESNGDFKNIAIANCVFDDCRGLAIESVDGSVIEDVAISNITMRHVANSPIFIRLGDRARGPGHPPPGAIRRVSIDNIVASDAEGDLGCIISGIPGHPVEDVRISNVRIVQQGGGSGELADRVPPEAEAAYPEPGMFGKMPSYGFFIRHAAGIELSHVKLDYAAPEARPAFVLDDVKGAYFDHVDARRGGNGAPLFEFRGVADYSISGSPNCPDTRNRGFMGSLVWPIPLSDGNSASTPALSALAAFTATDVPAMGPSEQPVDPPNWTVDPVLEHAAFPGNGPAQHPMMVIGEGCNKIFLVRDGKVIWTYSTGKGWEYDDAWLLSNGDTLFSRMSYAEEVTPQKRVVWHLDAPAGTEIHTVQPIGLDRVLLVENGLPPRLMVINKRTGAVEVDHVPPSPSPTDRRTVHGQFRRARMTASGTYLLPLLEMGKVVEYDRNFREIWSYAIPSPWAAVRLHNGNTLITDEKDALTREVSPNGKTVWEFNLSELPPGIPFPGSQSCVRLENGNTILCSRGNLGKGCQMVEVTPAKKVVWAMYDWNDFGPVTAVQILDDPGIPENPGDLQR